jgi:hypothetical protein
MAKIDEIIRLVREEMTVANQPGQSGGFSSSSPAEGPTAGFDPVMSFPIRRKRNGKFDLRHSLTRKYKQFFQHWDESNT